MNESNDGDPNGRSAATAVDGTGSTNAKRVEKRIQNRRNALVIRFLPGKHYTPSLPNAIGGLPRAHFSHELHLYSRMISSWGSVAANPASLYSRRAPLKRANLVFLGLLLLCLPTLHAQTGQKPLTLQDVIHPDSIITRGISSLSWRPGGKQLTFVRSAPGNAGASTLSAYDVDTHRGIVLFNPADRSDGLDLNSYQWSPRGDSILLVGRNDFWVLDSQTAGLQRLTHDGVEKEVPTFSPSGDRVAFVKKHNLFIVDIKTGVVRQLTHDGSDTIYNGLLDWVYGEELANRSTARAYEWSPDGKRIAYLRLDDRPVPDYPITDYLATHVRLVHERFPQAGDPNPLPSLHVVSIDDATTKPATIALDHKLVEYFGPTFTWTPDGASICFLALNRAQTDVAVHRWSPRLGTDRVLFVEHDPYWVNSLEPPKFLKGGREFLWVSERDGWQHLYLYTAEGKLEHQITRGAWMLDNPVFQDAPLFQLDPQQNCSTSLPPIPTRASASSIASIWTGAAWRESRKGRARTRLVSPLTAGSWWTSFRLLTRRPLLDC